MTSDASYVALKLLLLTEMSSNSPGFMGRTQLFRLMIAYHHRALAQQTPPFQPGVSISAN
jgi:hypothetical protein